MDRFDIFECSIAVGRERPHRGGEDSFKKAGGLTVSQQNAVYSSARSGALLRCPKLERNNSHFTLRTSGSFRWNPSKFSSSLTSPLIDPRLPTLNYTSFLTFTLHSTYKPH